MDKTIDRVILVRDYTALERLVARFNTLEQARFYIEHAGGDFQSYIETDQAFQYAFQFVVKTLASRMKYQVLFREFLPNFIFAENQLVIALGRDGLVANTAKYATNCPIVGINPDPDRIDGKLCLFHPKELPVLLHKIPQLILKEVSLAEAKLNDGQRLLAFNDLFIGPVSHTSARYRLGFKGAAEVQSSSGIIISTGAGSSGWLSSICHMAQSVTQLIGKKEDLPPIQMNWDSQKLVFVVREPFLSKSSSIQLTSGFISTNDPLTIESQMPAGGLIFSDGIESDFLHFNAGTIAEIGLSSKKAYIATQ